MGNSEAGTPPKSEKTSSSVQEQTVVHPYPDWAAMQAYYGPGVGMPPPYFSTAVTTGHAPHPYMWGPQPLMPHFGAPYPAIYQHGGVYSHPSAPLGQPIVASTAGEAATATHEAPAKSSSNKDRGLMKKLKGFDGLAVSIGNGSASTENEAEVATHTMSQSEGGTEGSSDGSDGSNSQGGKQTQRKRSSEVTSATGKPIRSIPSGVSIGTDARVSATGKVKTIVTSVPPPNSAVVPGRNGMAPELWLQDERELKRERRKQSNRESARRSRLRKQAESEELAMKVESLNAENLTLKAEISRLAENSAKLRLENSALVDKLKNAQSGKAGEISSDKAEASGTPSGGIENFLSKIDNQSSLSRIGEQESDTQEKSTGKLHQLLESSPRTDAVAAG